MNIIEEWDEDLGPVRAQYFLDRRPLDNILRMTKGAQRARVAKMSAEMSTGHWKKTHQGMLVGPNDELLDGAGRCLAIVASGVTIRMHVTRCDAVSARNLPIDSGVMRSKAYQLQRPKILMNVAQLAARFLLGEQRLALTDSELNYICTDVERTWLSFGGNGFRTRLCNNAALQLSACAVIEMRMRPAESMNRIFRAMDNNDPKALPPLVYSFWRQYSEKKMGVGDTLSRAWRSFQEADEDIPKLTIKNPDLPRTELRWALRRAFPTLRALVAHVEQQQALRAAEQARAARPQASEDDDAGLWRGPEKEAEDGHPAHHG